MDRFPRQVKWENGRPEKVMVAGKYAQVRIQLCELADSLAEHDADVVLSVLKKLTPVIKDRVKQLEDDLDITSDYSFHMERQDEKDM